MAYWSPGEKTILPLIRAAKNGRFPLALITKETWCIIPELSTNRPIVDLTIVYTPLVSNISLPVSFGVIVIL